MYVANGRVLLMRRREGVSHGGTWAFPAGHLEVGESPLQCAIRESIEEAGHEPAGDLTLLRQDGDITLYLCRGDKFTPALNDEHDGFVWATPMSLPTPLHPGIEEMLSGAMDKADSARLVDTNGWFEVRDNPISKAGVFPYKGVQLPGAPDPDKIYGVFRPPEELADPETIDSFRLLPWIDNHVMLGSEDLGMTPAEKKGVQGVIGEDVYFADGTLYANLKVFSQALADAINAGKRELSCGYRCTYEWVSGVFEGNHYDAIQRRIRGNHIASVKAGRMGSDVAVQDEYALDHFTFALDGKACTMADEKKVEKKEVTEGGGQGETKGGGKPEGEGPGAMSLGDAVAAIKHLMPALKMISEHAATITASGRPETSTENEESAGEAPVPKAKVDEEDEDDTMDAMKGKGKDGDMDKPGSKKDTPGKAPGNPDNEKGKEGQMMDEAFKAMASRFAQRDALARQVSVHVGTFDHSEMTLAEVAAYGVTKLGITASKGAELPTLQGYLAGKGNPAAGARSAVAADSKGGENFVTRYLTAA